MALAKINRRATPLCFTTGCKFCFLCFLSPDLELGPTLVLTLHPIETTHPGTTEVGSEATTEATGGPIITGEETEAITRVVITRTEVAAMVTRAIGKEVVAVAVAVVEGGMIARTTVHTVPGGGVPAHLRSAQAAGAGLATPTAHLRGNLDTLGGPVIPHIPGLHLHVTAAKASPTPRKQKQPAVSLRGRDRQRRAASSKRRLEVNGLTMTQVPNPAQTIRKKHLPMTLMGKVLRVVAPFGKPLAVCLLQIRVPQSREKRQPSVALASSQRKMPKMAIRM